MSKGNNNWWMINTILLIIIIFILISRCNKNSIYHGEIFNINLKRNDECIKENNNKDIIIEDKNGNYEFQKELEIFNNSFLNDKIAPGISSIYYFQVHNNSNINIKYTLAFNDISNDLINLKYRLKRNNKYILGKKWLNADEIKVSFINLKKGKTDSYSLEWKWFDNDEVDNYIGENILSKYLLNINFNLK